MGALCNTPCVVDVCCASAVLLLTYAVTDAATINMFLDFARNISTLSLTINTASDWRTL